MANSLRRLFDPGDWLAARPQLDPLEIRLHFQHKAAPSEWKLRIAVGLAVLLAAACAAWFVADDFIRFVLAGFGFFGLLNLVLGVSQSAAELSLTISGSEVRVIKKTLFGEKTWREPLPNYRGVLLRESQTPGHSVGNIETSTRYQIIELAHDDARKTIPLYVEKGVEPPRRIHQDFAERLRLPALAEDIARGPVAVHADRSQPAQDPGPPPSGVSLTREGGATRIGVETGLLSRTLAPLFYLSVVLVFGFIGYQVEPLASLAAAGMAALLLGMMFAAARILGKDNRPAAICLTNERVWIDRPASRVPAFIGTIRNAMQQTVGAEAPELHPVVESLPLRAVERIRLDRYHSQSGEGSTPLPRLLIEAEAGRLEFMASQFDERKLEWVRRYLEWRIGD